MIGVNWNDGHIFLLTTIPPGELGYPSRGGRIRATNFDLK